MIDRVFVGLLVEGQQHIDGIAARSQALFGKADLIEAVAAFDLGGWNGIGQDVVTGARGGLSDHLSGDSNTFAGFTGDTDDEIFAGHVSKPPPDDRHEARLMRALAERAVSAAPSLGAHQAGRANEHDAGPTDSPLGDTAERGHS